MGTVKCAALDAALVTRLFLRRRGGGSLPDFVLDRTGGKDNEDARLGAGLGGIEDAGTSGSGRDCAGVLFDVEVGESTTIAIGDDGTGGKMPMGAGRRFPFVFVEMGGGGMLNVERIAVLGGGGRLNVDLAAVAGGAESLKDVFHTGAEGIALLPKLAYR